MVGEKRSGSRMVAARQARPAEQAQGVNERLSLFVFLTQWDTNAADIAFTPVHSDLRKAINMKIKLIIIFCCIIGASGVFFL